MGGECDRAAAPQRADHQKRGVNGHDVLRGAPNLAISGHVVALSTLILVIGQRRRHIVADTATGW
jgi:hypothetical protein